LFSTKNLTGQARLAVFLYQFPEETDKTQSPSALIYDVPLTERYFRFTSTPAGSKFTKRISYATQGS